MIRFLKRLDFYWEKIEQAILSITIISMSFMLIGNAVSRSFLNKSWAFTEEVGKIGVIVLTSIGIGYAARKQMHIEMSGFYDLLPNKIKRYVYLFIQIGSAFILAILTYLSFQYVQHLYKLGQVTTILRVPLHLTMFVIPLGFLLGTIRYIVDFLKAIISKKELEENL